MDVIKRSVDFFTPTLELRDIAELLEWEPVILDGGSVANMCSDFDSGPRCILTSRLGSPARNARSVSASTANPRA